MRVCGLRTKGCAPPPSRLQLSQQDRTQPRLHAGTLPQPPAGGLSFQGWRHACHRLSSRPRDLSLRLNLGCAWLRGRGSLLWLRPHVWDQAPRRAPSAPSAQLLKSGETLRAVDPAPREGEQPERTRSVITADSAGREALRGSGANSRGPAAGRRGQHGQVRRVRHLPKLPQKTEEKQHRRSLLGGI